MSKEVCNRIVSVRRTLRDGKVTDEYLPRWIAEIVVGNIPQNEPMTARAIIVEPSLINVNPSAVWSSVKPKPRWDIARNMASLAGYPISFVH
jgi:hypothetical protein